jgi:acetyl esterase/lipase
MLQLFTPNIDSQEATRQGSPLRSRTPLPSIVIVLDQGVDPTKIIISGDSAGGSLVIALLRYIEKNKTLGLPSPRGVMAWSPWVDISDKALAKYANNPLHRIDWTNLSFSK